MVMGIQVKSFERYLKDKKIDFDIFDSNIAEYNQNYNFEDFDPNFVQSWNTKRHF